MTAEIHYVYFIQCKPRGSIKIGVALDPEERCKTLQTANQKKLAVIAKFPCGSRRAALDLEAWLHSELRYFRMNGEWFNRRIIRHLKTGGKRIIKGDYLNPEQRFSVIDISNSQAGGPNRKQFRRGFPGWLPRAQGGA